ncbi:MAG TPA: hypothetical protein VME19_14655 [Streptosporangiaceae bacterium]|nr:hypothetical protein [Streptosporangiaceae bacterium]
MHISEYIQHPCTTLHLTGRAPRPVKVNDGRVGINGKIGPAITTLVGTVVGQNLQANASDKRAAQTYEDAEAVLHEATQIQQHLVAQDAVLAHLIAAVAAGVSVPGGPAGALGTAGA